MITTPNRPETLYNKEIVITRNGPVIKALTIFQEWDYETKELFPWVTFTYMNGDRKIWKRVHCNKIKVLGSF